MPETDLDAPGVYERLDPDGLLGRIDSLPDQIEEAHAAGAALALPQAYRGVERVAVLGLGGSSIGGALLKALAEASGAAAPVTLVRGYDVPAHVDERCLAIASSSSGNTEETVSAFERATDAGARCIALTTGGRIAEIAERRRVPLLRYAWSGEPRSALGWSFAAPLAVCAALGLVPNVRRELHGATAAMRELRKAVGRDVPEQRNAAKQLARRIAGKAAVIVGAEALAPVAYRWRTQMNENGKTWGIELELPEMNHNTPVGYGKPEALVPLLHAVFLRHASMHPRTALRVDATMVQMRARRIAAEALDVPGATVLAQMLWAVLFGDYVSYYVGLLNGERPSPVEALDDLKRVMSSKG
jgi:glucose/mannose-6-phosphate isomerase